MPNPQVVVDFISDTSSLNKGFSQASGAAGGLGSKLKTLAKTGAVAGIAALGAAVKIGVGEFAQAQKVTAQTGAAIKSTGGAANVTTKQIQNLSGALMEKSGVDDEAIQSGANLLLTFTNIRNEAGKGNDVFNQTTAAALDMSVALGTDMKSAAMQLGKALNDPVKGVTKLQRSGVTFTEAQKKQIAALQESGKTLEAQKIILAEVNKEFGGSAEAAGKTLPGQLNILKESFSNLAGEMVGKAVPVLLQIAELLNSNRTAVIAVASVVATLTVATLAVSAATAAWNAIQVIASGAAKAWAAAQWLVNLAMTANPIALVVVAIAALVAGMILAYKTSDTFRNAVDAAFAAILGAAEAVFNWLKANWPLLLAIITGPIGVATLMVIRNWDTIKGAVSSAVNAVRGAVTGAWGAVASATASAWEGVRDTVTSVIGGVRSALNALATWISGFASGVLSAAVNRVANMFDKIADGASDALSAVRSSMNSIVAAISGIIDRVANAASGIANAIKRPINAVINAWNGLAFRIPEVKIPKLKIGKKTFGGGGFGGATISFPNIPTLAAGGVVDSPTLALVGEAGREIVAPESLLRQIVGERDVQVRVFIGSTELTDLVRTEIVDANTGIARTLLAGGSA